MVKIKKRPKVISDLIEIATYIGQNNLSASDRFLLASEETFKQLQKLPYIGKICQFSHPKLVNIRQHPIKGFRNYLIFYCVTEDVIEVLRVLNGVRDIEAILDNDVTND